MYVTLNVCMCIDYVYDTKGGMSLTLSVRVCM